MARSPVFGAAVGLSLAMPVTTAVRELRVNDEHRAAVAHSKTKSTKKRKNHARKNTLSVNGWYR